MTTKTKYYIGLDINKELFRKQYEKSYMEIYTRHSGWMASPYGIRNMEEISKGQAELEITYGE